MATISMRHARSSRLSAMASAAFRPDPYYRDVWTDSRAEWISGGELREEIANPRLRNTVPPFLRNEGRGDFGWLSTPGKRRAALDALAVIGAWRTVTAWQLAAFTGQREAWGGKTATMTKLIHNDLVDYGRFAKSPPSTPLDAGLHEGPLYRANPESSAAFEELSSWLTYTERMGVTGGTPWKVDHQHDRHNVLTTELALRIAEFCGVKAVLGEPFSTVQLLAPDDASPTSTRMADATIVRRDGLKIAVELTANTGSREPGAETTKIRRKIEAWMRLLSKQDLNATGLVVLFVVADDKHRRGTGSNEVANALRKEIYEAGLKLYGGPRQYLLSRFFVSEWKDWFPAEHMADEGFFELRSMRAVGSIDDRWHPASILNTDDVSFAPSDPHRAEAIIYAARELRASPYWLRNDAATPLWKYALPFSVQVTERDWLTNAAMLTPRGAAGSAGLPARLEGA